MWPMNRTAFVILVHALDTFSPSIHQSEIDWKPELVNFTSLLIYMYDRNFPFAHYFATTSTGEFTAQYICKVYSESVSFVRQHRRQFYPLVSTNVWHYIQDDVLSATILIYLLTISWGGFRIWALEFHLQSCG